MTRRLIALSSALIFRVVRILKIAPGKSLEIFSLIIFISELGEKVKDDPNIVIAKIDVTANHPPRHFSYEGFPTIFWAGMSTKVCIP